MSPPRPQRCVATSDFLERDTASRHLILATEGAAIRLNAPANLIWLRIQSGDATRATLIDEAADVFGRDPVEIAPFVDVTIQELEKLGVVEWLE